MEEGDARFPSVKHAPVFVTAWHRYRPRLTFSDLLTNLFVDGEGLNVLHFAQEIPFLESRRRFSDSITPEPRCLTPRPPRPSLPESQTSRVPSATLQDSTARLWYHPELPCRGPRNPQRLRTALEMFREEGVQRVLAFLFLP